jgi:hypothetical protein
MAARSRAQPAKAAKSHIIDRGSETDDETTAPMLRTSLTDTSGLTLATSRRRPSAPSPDSADVRATSVIALGMRRSSTTACGKGTYRAPVITGGALRRSP